MGSTAHLVLLDHLQRLVDGLVGLVAVVAHQQLDLAAVDAALGIDLLEHGLGAAAHALAQAGCRAGLHVDHAQAQRAGADAVAAGQRGQGHAGQQGQQGERGEAVAHEGVSGRVDGGI